MVFVSVELVKIEGAEKATMFGLCVNMKALHPLPWSVEISKISRMRTLIFLRRPFFLTTSGSYEK